MRELSKQDPCHPDPLSLTRVSKATGMTRRIDEINFHGRHGLTDQQGDPQSLHTRTQYGI
jgi:hypothetical protein